MAEGKRDDNNRVSALAVSTLDATVLLLVKVNPVGNGLIVVLSS